jgi:hypothetical protein
MPDGPSSGLPWGGWCPVEIGDLLTSSGVDLSGRGFELRNLGPDFVATDFSLRGACPQGSSSLAAESPAEGVLAVDRSYRHGDAFWVWLTQQQEPERTVDALYSSGATFWSGGSMFTLWAWGQPVGAPQGGAEDATAVVEHAIGELAPELDLECFYREASGEWSDLAGLGVGDPRPVLPADLEQSWFYLQLFEDPPAACGALDVDMPVYFAAGFSNTTDHVGVSAWPRWGYGVPGTGSLHDYGVWWSTDRYQLSAYSYRGGQPAEPSLLIELAQALDPGLDPRCLRRLRQLAPQELAGLGLPRATAPGAWELRHEQLQVELPQEGCAVDPQHNRSVWLSWYFEIVDASTARRVLYATVHRDAGWLEPGAIDPIVNDHSISWRDDQGTWYSVYGYSTDGTSVPLFDELAAVARSLDPELELP